MGKRTNLYLQCITHLPRQQHLSMEQMWCEKIVLLALLRRKKIELPFHDPKVPSKMCKICYLSLGPTKPHKEHECPLAQAAHCSRCGTNGHFTSTCAFKPKRVPFLKQAIASVPAEPAPKSYAMADTNEAYVEYNRLFNLPVQGTLELNKQTAVEHLLTRGFILEPQPTRPPKRVVIVRKSAA